MSAPWIGIMGGGQLAEMLAHAAYALGLRVRVLDPSADAPAGHVAPLVAGAFDDSEALTRLAQSAACVTIETENVPVRALRMLRARRVPVRPGPLSLEVAADRLREKRFAETHGVGTAEFRAVSSAGDLRAAALELGPIIAKTRTLGYDGRGQVRIERAADADAAWYALGGRPLLAERVVAFRRELSLVSARSLTGDIRHFPLVENRHENGILRETIAPADVSPALQAEAEAIAGRLLRALGHIGVLTIELFETDDGLILNEMAPRVHNSGHWTIEGATSSQFETHLRAILGWPLRPTRARGHARMINLIGNAPDPAALELDENAHLHLYRKEARPLRKLGHVTLVDDDRTRLAHRAAALAGRLEGADAPAGPRRPGAASISRRTLIRSAVAGGAALAVAALPGAAAGTRRTGAPLPWPATPEEALQRLRDGNDRFVEGRPEALRRSLDRVRETADGQAPFAAILGCADSRVPPEILFDQGIGDLFVVRVAGNVATPEEIASLEYAVAVLGTKLVLVLGHSSCGAVQAALAGGPVPGQISALYQHFQPALDAANGDVGRAVELNVAQQVGVLRRGSPVLREAIAGGTLAVAGAVYHLPTGQVEMLPEGA